MLIVRFCKISETKRVIYAVFRNNCTYKLLRVGFDSLLLRQKPQDVLIAAILGFLSLNITANWVVIEGIYSEN